MGRKQITIECCNKKLLPEVSYSVQDYPGIGDTTEIHPAICPQCLCQRFAFESFNFRGWDTGLQQADKHRRLKFKTILASGEYRVIVKPDANDKPTKGAPIAGEYTRKIKRPAEESISYLDKVKKAESNDISSLDTLLLCG